LFTAKRVQGESEFSDEKHGQVYCAVRKASCCVKLVTLRAQRTSRTLTCRNLARTGDMLRLKVVWWQTAGVLLYLRLRCCRVFQNGSRFLESKFSQFNQLGNAVPPLLAFAMAKQVRRYLKGAVLRERRCGLCYYLKNALGLSQNTFQSSNCDW